MDNSSPYAWLRQNLNRNDANSQIIHYRYFPQGTRNAQGVWNVDACYRMYNWPESARLTGLPDQGIPSGRHAGGVNCSFADGHSKWLKTGEQICKPERGFRSL